RPPRPAPPRTARRVTLRVARPGILRGCRRGRRRRFRGVLRRRTVLLPRRRRRSSPSRNPIRPARATVTSGTAT
ncbi:hypothetical protein E1285_44575, partial [Actinomadura sp. 7K507]